MSEGSPLPPVVQIALSERLSSLATAAELKHALGHRSLEKELVRQAKWTVKKFDYSEQGSAAGFSVAAAGSLNPFDGAFKCANFACRMNSVDEFVKSVALYVDDVVIPDPLTTLFAVEDRIDYDELFVLLQVYAQVAPLVDSGLLRFASPVQHYCDGCATRMKTVVSRAADRIVSEATRDLVNAHLYGDRLLGITWPSLYADSRHPLVMAFPISDSDANRFRAINDDSSALLDFVKPLLATRLASTAHQVLFEMKMAQRQGALMLSGSRAELLCLSEVEGQRPSLHNLENWEATRHFRLPWIAELTVAECLELRENAATALPKLRALLATRLHSSPDSNSESLFAELRAQVADVEAELASIKRLGERKYQLAAEALGFGVVLYGALASSPPVAVAGLAALLAALNHAQASAREAETKDVKIKSAPAFALLQAKQILEKRQ